MLRLDVRIAIVGAVECGWAARTRVRPHARVRPAMASEALAGGERLGALRAHMWPMIGVQQTAMSGQGALLRERVVALVARVGPLASM